MMFLSFLTLFSHFKQTIFDSFFITYLFNKISFSLIINLQSIYTFLMRDGQIICIQLKNYTYQNGVVFYNFEICLNSKKIFWSERYSKLCKLTQQLPKIIAFPSKISLRGIKNLFFNKTVFVEERFCQLKQYFQNEKIIKALQKSPQFIQRIEQLEFEQKSINIQNCKPRGKKLQYKQLDEYNQYIVA